MTAEQYRQELDLVTKSGMLKINQVAQYTGLSYPAAREFVMAHGGRKFGSTWRIAKPELARWLASGK